MNETTQIHWTITDKTKYKSYDVMLLHTVSLV